MHIFHFSIVRLHLIEHEAWEETDFTQKLVLWFQTSGTKRVGFPEPETQTPMDSAAYYISAL